MKLLFRTNYPKIEDTTPLDECFEPELRYATSKDKAAVLKYGLFAYAYHDDHLIGEIYGLPAVSLDWDPETPGYNDVVDYMFDYNNRDYTVYCCSLAVLPYYRHTGVGKSLAVYWNGYCRGKGYEVCIGHTTSVPAKLIRLSMGALLGPTHENWGGTHRTATFYEQEL